MADAVAQEYQEYPANALLVPHLVCFFTQTIADGAPRPHPVCPMPASTSSSSGRSVRPSAHEMLDVDVPLRETDPAQWSSYGLLPLQVAPTPTARYFPDFEAAIAANLDHLLERQGGTGRGSGPGPGGASTTCGSRPGWSGKACSPWRTPESSAGTAASRRSHALQGRSPRRRQRPCAMGGRRRSLRRRREAARRKGVAGARNGQDRHRRSCQRRRTSSDRRRRARCTRFFTAALVMPAAAAMRATASSEPRPPFSTRAR